MCSENGEALAAAIRTRFPVAMIDEFQDTDPQQYRIFRRIWRQQPNTALLLIGDPKQAIYAFRGADIFTYMKARSEVEAHYTLDTNWRSSPGMVESVNALFGRMDSAFMFREIPFQPVKFAARNASLRFEFNGVNQPAMNFWLLDGEGAALRTINMRWLSTAPRRSGTGSAQVRAVRRCFGRGHISPGKSIRYYGAGAQPSGGGAYP